MASTATALLSNRATLGRAAVVSVRTKSQSNVFKLYREGLKSWRLKGSNPVPNEVAIHKTGCFWDFLLAYSVFSLNLGWSTFFSFPGQQNEKRKSRTHEETRTASPTSSWTPASWPESKKLFSARNNDVCNKQKGNASEREAHKAKNVNVSQPGLILRMIQRIIVWTPPSPQRAQTSKQEILLCTKWRRRSSADLRNLSWKNQAAPGAQLSVCTSCRSDPGLL